MQVFREAARPPWRWLLPLIPLMLLALPALAQEAGKPESNTQRPLSYWFLAFIVLVGGVVGRWVWNVRLDYMRVIGPSIEGGAGIERITLFRDSSAGLPEGTIRAALALLVVCILLPALVLEQPLGLSGTGEIGTILGGILGFYFGTRSGGGEAEGFRRQAETFMGQAREQEDAAKQAEVQRQVAVTAKHQAERARDEVAQERDTVVQQADTRVADARTGILAETAEGQKQILALQARAQQALAVAQAVAGMLPAGPAARAISGTLATAGGVLDEAAQAGAAVQAALLKPDAGTIGNALEAARSILARAGEGTDIADRLGTALGVLRDATSVAGQVQEAVRNPSAANVAEALGAAGLVLSRTGGGGFAATLAPALGTIGTVMRMPGLMGMLGAATPVGVVGGIVLGAWQAWRIGNAHYTRWMARVLDRPVTPDLFPAAAWDGGAARVLLARVPTLARVFKPEIEGASQQEMADLLGQLFRADAVTELLRSRGEAFLSPIEAENAVNELRRLVLDEELDRESTGPVPLPGGATQSQAAFRDTLDKLREAGAGGAIEGLGLLAGTLIRARPLDAQGNAIAVDLPRLLEEALPVANADPGASAQDMPPPPPPPEGEPPV